MNKIWFAIRAIFGLETVTTVGYNHPQQGEITAKVIYYNHKEDMATIAYIAHDGAAKEIMQMADWLKMKASRKAHNLRNRHLT